MEASTQTGSPTLQISHVTGGGEVIIDNFVTHGMLAIANLKCNQIDGYIIQTNHLVFLMYLLFCAYHETRVQ